MNTVLEPPCVAYAKEHGPAPDDSLAWTLNLAAWLKKQEHPLDTTPMQIIRWLNASDSLEDMGDEEVLATCKAAYNNSSEISCNDLMGCPSFSPGCSQEACPLYVQPVVPLVEGPTAKRLFLSDPPGTVGVCEDGTVGIVVTAKNDNTFIDWISDCMVYIHTETIAENEREFVFEGIGATDKRKVRFTMPAEDMADAKKFKAALINAFGAANRVGKLTFEVVQQITKDTITRRRLCAPAWVEDMPMVPGVALADDIEFKLLPMIPAEVHDGNLEASLETLGKLLDIPGPTMILVTIVLGSPIYARWFQNDRFGAGVWGRTGSMKTSIAKKTMCIYGTGYNDDANLLKHGKSGSTAVGELEVLAGAGILPEIIDNVKSVDPRDAQQYIATIHAVIEGKDKIRGKKDGGIRNSKPFLCTPIVTGEVKPDEASTSARILNLKWTEPKSKVELDYVQRNLADLPVIGYHWLRYLAAIDFDITAGFDEVRTRKTDLFNSRNYTNSGRLATIYSLVRLTWDQLCKSPLADAFKPRTDRFLEALDAACEDQGSMVTEETEVSKFISGINAILSSQPHLIQQYENQMPDEYGKSYRQDVIGRWIEHKEDRAAKDLFLIPEPTLNTLKRLGVFTQIPTPGSITDALFQSGYLADQKSKRRRVQQKMNGYRVYGWQIKAECFKRSEDGESISEGFEVDEVKIA